eukprot:GDKH01013306.1.p1 GENE.GDKH01013306.1~~GDKH01013306.1.p1  ORF type:complete len:232 (-),score=67.21 GDKH01013306.1:254-949(-)
MPGLSYFARISLKATGLEGKMVSFALIDAKGRSVPVNPNVEFSRERRYIWTNHHLVTEEEGKGEVTIPFQQALSEHERASLEISVADAPEGDGSPRNGELIYCAGLDKKDDFHFHTHTNKTENFEPLDIFVELYSEVLEGFDSADLHYHPFGLFELPAEPQKRELKTKSWSLWDWLFCGAGKAAEADDNDYVDDSPQEPEESYYVDRPEYTEEEKKNLGPDTWEVSAPWAE